MSSSPALPSLSQLIAGKNARKSTRSPGNFNNGFSSARNLLAEFNQEDAPFTHLSNDSLAFESKNHVSDSTEEILEPDRMKEQVPEISGKCPPPKGRCKSGTSLRSKVSPHFPGSRLPPPQVEKLDGSDSRRSTKKPRKADQTKITNIKVRKPRICAGHEKKFKATDVTRGRAEEASKDREEAKDPKVDDLTTAEAEQGLGLMGAIKRRQAWTPVKNTSDRPDIRTEHAVAWSALIPGESPDLGELKDARFERLLGHFACSKIDRSESAASHVPRSPTIEAATKRRKLDLVSSKTLSIGKLISEKGGKSPKKRPQTITEKATAPFVSSNQIGTSTLLDYFASSAATEAAPLSFAAQERHGAEGGQEKPKKLAQKRRPKVKKKVKEVAKLHSPERALKAAREQDLLFGTSSQLAREESPTFIRTLQQAIKESENDDGSQTVSQEGESQLSAQSIASNGSCIRKAAASRNLWSAAARDDAGLLHNVDVVDLVDTPQAPRVRSNPIKAIDIQEGQQVPLGAIAQAIDKGWKAEEGVTATEILASLVIEENRATDPLPRSIAEASLRQRPKSKSPVKKKKIQDKGPAAKPQHAEMPNYDGFTDVDLRKAVTAFGFRSKKKREHLITLLKECWESKNRTALQSLPPNVSAPPMPTELGSETGPQASDSLKKRGRPPKNAVVASAPDDAKVASDAILKRPRGRPRKEVTEGSSRSKKHAKTPPKEMVTKGVEAPIAAASKPANQSSEPPRGRSRSSSHQDDQLVSTNSRSMKLSGSDLKDRFATITKAVKRTEPTHDAQNLTWYEKILLYDPIVLEDLADWLNKEGLARVQCVTMVTPLMVKQWCESQSICCLWKESLRGGTRARY
ncbi:MAG: hypothetical protein LQ352_003799 [Teloschistes flavicans]|nr:MAG: hypothetical protein LQ352_003799 [Teloschistes flavicans]